MVLKARKRTQLSLHTQAPGQVGHSEDAVPLTCGAARYDQGVPEGCTLHLDCTLEGAGLGHRIHGTLLGHCLISTLDDG